MIPTENQEAEVLANWLRIKQYTFTHIANESWLPPRVAMLASARKKRMWLSPWVPDFMIILKWGGLLFIELKRKKKVLKSWKLWASPSKVSDEQIEWIEKLNTIYNVQWVFAYWAEEAIKIIWEFEEKIKKSKEN